MGPINRAARDSTRVAPVSPSVSVCVGSGRHGSVYRVAGTLDRVRKHQGHARGNAESAPSYAVCRQRAWQALVRNAPAPLRNGLVCVLSASRDALDMKLMPGKSLLQLMETEAEPPVEVRLNLCVGILKVVKRIQSLQIVHRDVSNPGNWIVDGTLDAGGALSVGLVDPDFSVAWFPGLLQHINRSWTQPHTPENQTARGAKMLDKNEDVYHVAGVLVAICVWSLGKPPEPLAVLGLARAPLVPKLREALDALHHLQYPHTQVQPQLGEALNAFWVWTLAGVAPGPARQMVRKQARGWVRYALHTTRRCGSGARFAAVLYVVRAATAAATAPTTMLGEDVNDTYETFMRRLIKEALRLDVPRRSAATILGVVMLDAIPEVAPGWQRGSRSAWNKLSADRMREVQGVADRLLYFFYRNRGWQRAGGSAIIVAAAAALHMLWDAAAQHSLMLPYPLSHFSVRINATAAALSVVCWQTYADVPVKRPPPMKGGFRRAWLNHWQPAFDVDDAYDMVQTLPIPVITEAHTLLAPEVWNILRPPTLPWPHAISDALVAAALAAAPGAHHLALACDVVLRGLMKGTHLCTTPYLRTIALLSAVGMYN